MNKEQINQFTDELNEFLVNTKLINLDLTEIDPKAVDEVKRFAFNAAANALYGHLCPAEEITEEFKSKKARLELAF